MTTYKRTPHRVLLLSCTFVLLCIPRIVMASTLSDLITTAANDRGLPPTLLAAVMQNESGFDPNKISSTGCVGLGQLCKESAQKPTIAVQCSQDSTAGPATCSNSCTDNGSYVWCTPCSGGGCQPDDRFDVEKNIRESARVLSSKVQSIKTAGCDLTTEAGVKAAAYAYNMGAGRLTPAIAAVGCTDFDAIWQEARDHFDPVECITDNDCGSGNTCGQHSEFPGTDLCLEDGDPLGIVYTSSPVTLGKLERKRGDVPGTYVSNIYEDFVGFGGSTPNEQFRALTLGAGSTMSGAAVNLTITPPNLFVTIPGLSFATRHADQLVRRDSNGGIFLQIPYLAEYIAALFRYLVGVLIIIAAVALIVGGILYMTSGAAGDTARAKSVIQQALLGLILVLSSYLILQIINPDLTNIGIIEVQLVQGTSIFQESVVTGEAPLGSTQSPRIVSGSPTTIPPGGIPYGFNNVPWYFQYDPQWASIQYGNQSHCTTIGQGGCGPSSIAMVLKHYGIDVNPTHIADIAVRTGARVCNSGTDSSDTFFAAVAAEYQMEYTVVSRQTSIAFLEAGLPALSGGPHRGFTSQGNTKGYRGHFIVFTGIENGTQGTRIVHVNDPGNRPQNGITHMDISEYLGASRDVVIFVPASEIPQQLANYFTP